MDFEVALRLAAFFVGAFVHGVFVFGVLGRVERRPSERVLRLFFTAIFCWHAGSFLALALGGAEGPQASLVRRIANLVAFVGLAFQPPLLVQAITSEGRERKGLPPRGPWEAPLLWLVYAPLAGLPLVLWLIARPPEVPPLTRLGPLIVPWTLWYAGTLAFSALVALNLGRATSPLDRRLDRGLALTFSGAAIGLVYVYVLGGRFQRLGYTLETLVMASSIPPTLVFTYYVYRYRVLGYFVRDGVVSLLASASVVAAYIFFVPELARRAASWVGIPALFLEGSVLVVLVLLFEPYGESLRALARRYLAGGRERLRRKAALCARKLTRALSVDEVALALSSTLEEAAILRRVRLLVAEDVPSGALEVDRLEELAPVIGSELASGRALVSRDSPVSGAALEELRALDAHAALALRTKGRLHGALLLSGAERRGLYPEDLEDLAGVVEGAALALESAQLLAERSSAERKVAAAERMASLGWLAASVAHEVKNPLSSIKAVAQVLEREVGEGHRFKEDLALIVREANRLDGAVERLLRSTREPQAERGSVDLVPALDRIAIALGPQARTRGVQFEFRGQARSARVSAGEEDLWEIFYNLAINAMDAMAAGGVLRVEWRESPDPGWLAVRVRDDGEGIPAELEARIFDPFFTTKEHGHGLGLAIVKRRLREIGGSIRYLRGEPGGACFELLLRTAE